MYPVLLISSLLINSATSFVLPQKNYDRLCLGLDFKNHNHKRRTSSNCITTDKGGEGNTFFNRGEQVFCHGLELGGWSKNTKKATFSSSLYSKSKQSDSEGNDSDSHSDDTSTTVTKESSDGDKTNSVDVDLTETKTNTETKKEEKKEVSQTTRDATFQAFKLFSYVIQFLGLYFSFGLLLNILGYGYTFDFQSGFQVDKMENLRNEMQFRREIERSTSSSTRPAGAATVSEVLDDNVTPSSSLPR